MHDSGHDLGYARASTTGKDLAQHLAPLIAGGCVKSYRQRLIGPTAERPEPKHAIGALDDGDL